MKLSDTRRFVWPVFLFFLNFFVAHELFFTEYTDRVISGDGAFISISRYMLSHRGDSSWWPIWYNGIPGHNAYPPLLHQIVAWLAQLEGISAALTHHQFCVVVYALAPVSLYFLLLRFSGSVVAGAIGGLGFSLLSPSTLLIPWVRTGAGGWVGPWRLCVLEAYGDAPHMMSLALLPLVLLAVDLALEGRRRWHWLLASLLVAAVLLTNWLGSVGLACAFVAYLFATTSSRRELIRVWKTMGVCLAGYLMASPWIPLSTILLVRANGQVGDGDFRADMQWFPVRALVIVVIMVGLKYGLMRFRVSRGLRLAAMLLVLPGSIPLLREATGMSLFPQAHRYQWEMDLGIWVLGALLLHRVWTRSPRAVQYAGVAVVALAVGFQIAAYHRFSAIVVKPIDMTSTVEYKTAAWLQRHEPGRRVFAIGTVAYWMNNFSDMQQVSGGFDPGTPNEANRLALKSISAEAAGPTLLWLRAMGADLVAVGGPKTRAPFRTFTHPEKFDEFAQKIWSDGDDFIYRVPRRSASIAHVVRPGDVGELTRYVAALEDVSLPVASLAWRSGHEAVLRATVPKGDLISVQVNYDPGWHVVANGAARSIRRDGLGFMAIDPECDGDCRLKLTYDEGMEQRLAWIASPGTLLFLIVFGFAGVPVSAFGPSLQRSWRTRWR